MFPMMPFSISIKHLFWPIGTTQPSQHCPKPFLWPCSSMDERDRCSQGRRRRDAEPMPIPDDVRWPRNKGLKSPVCARLRAVWRGTALAIEHYKIRALSNPSNSHSGCPLAYRAVSRSHFSSDQKPTGKEVFFFHMKTHASREITHKPLAMCTGFHLDSSSDPGLCQSTSWPEVG